MPFPYFQTLMAECLKAQGVEDAEQVAAKAVATLERMQVPLRTLDRDAHIYRLSASIRAVDIGARFSITRIGVHEIIRRHQRLRHALLKTSA